MFSRHLVLALAAAGAVGLPVLLSSGPEPEEEPPVAAAAGAKTASAPQPERPPRTADKKSPRETNAAGRKSAARPASAAAPVSLEEVFQPTITPRWVMRHWTQISTVTDQVRTSGYRVALVTGTRADDLVGSLTYYFDARQRLRRIRFRGTTGNPDRLLALLQHTYQLRRATDTTAAVQEYRRMWNGRVVSWVRVWPSAVIDARRPQERFQVELVLEPPPQRKWFAPARLSPPELRL